MEQANILKEKGNSALAEGNFTEAIAAYTEAINLDPANHVLFSNRSAAYAKAGEYEESLKDANKTIELNTTWPKGYSRKGSALAGMQKFGDAFEAYQTGLEHDPSNAALMEGQKEVGQLIMAHLTKMSGQPMDIDPQSPPPPTFTQSKDQNKSSKGAASNKQSAHTKSSEDDNLPEPKRLAKRAKDAGNEAYKRKDFETALTQYDAAIEHDPTDITFYSNKAAVYFVQRNFEKCICECEKGIEIGRENRADFKLVAKALLRIGNAYKKLENWQLAKTFYEKSMSEHRTPEVKTLLSETEKLIKDAELKAYVDPEKAEEEKELGNDFFKKGNYSAALKHYSEAIKRNPGDPKLYSNRAACYTKLVAFDLGLKDCDKCIALDKTFIKGWIRKGKILQGMQEPSEALAAYQKALEIDPSNAEAIEGYRTTTMAVHSDPAEIMKKARFDPEVQAIIKDPAMRLILEQMQNDPKAVQEHLKNPAVASKIQKLLSSGIIQIH